MVCAMGEENVKLECVCVCVCFFFNDTATTEIYTLSLHDALPISFEVGMDLVRRVAAKHNLHGPNKKTVRAGLGSVAQIGRAHV